MKKSKFLLGCYCEQLSVIAPLHCSKVSSFHFLSSGGCASLLVGVKLVG